MRRKPWYKSRTVFVGALVAALGAVNALTNQGVLGHDATAWAVATAGVLTVMMRSITSQPVGLGNDETVDK